MQEFDKKRFAEALIAMGESYDREISQAFARMYFDDLKDYPINRVLEAFSEHRRDRDRGRFFPKVSDIIDKLEPRNVTYATSNHPALVAERLRLAKDGKALVVPGDNESQSIWQRMGYASEQDYYAGRRMH